MAGMKTLMAVAAIPLAVGAVTAQGTATLTNDDIIKMVRAQLANSIIVTTIESSSARSEHKRRAADGQGSWPVLRTSGCGERGFGAREGTETVPHCRPLRIYSHRCGKTSRPRVKPREFVPLSCVQAVARLSR